ncbi:leucine-rich repeat domain-containing protein [Xylanibacter rodentium]|uniref:leucine-rich repeat domain-containing protein n=1 Tax=Xylanibacter rodentium TaxID=2736289 RepID=UPI0025938A8F|nr:leucine-rich repeat domain-containing protein [Xylanibacter rodentium]
MRKQLQLRASAFPKLLWLMLLALLPTQLSARDFEYTYEGQTLTYTVLNEEAKTVQTKAGVYSSGTATPGNSVSGILNIPANVTDESGEQFTVTQIGQNGFPKCEITEIHFPETLTQIRDYAFQDCNQLEEVSLPSSLTTLHNGVFQTASALKSVRFEYSELNLTLGNNVFQNAPIESIYYGRNVNLDKVVSERSSLKSIEISDSLTKI